MARQAGPGMEDPRRPGLLMQKRTAERPEDAASARDAGLQVVCRPQGALRSSLILRRVLKLDL